MKQINVYELIIKNKDKLQTKHKQTLEEEIYKICRHYLLILKKNIMLYKDKLPITIMTLEFIDDNGLNITPTDTLQDALTNEIADYIYDYIKENYDFFKSSTIKEETKEEVFLFNYINSNTEENLNTTLNNYKIYENVEL